MTNRARSTLLLLEGATIPVAWLLGYLFGYPPLARFAWRTEAVTWGLLATLPMLVALGICLLWRPRWLGAMFELIDEMLVPMFRNWSLAELALVSALAGIGEEMIFRGVLQPAAAPHLGTMGAVVVVGLLFGLVHAANFVYFLFAAIVGCYFGALVVATDNLLVPMVAHGVYDFVAVVYLARLRTGDA